jgi:threonine synthase
MDVGDPSNFARVLDLYQHSHEAISNEISGCSYTDEQIAETMAKTYKETGYLLDPHGAVAYRSLEEGLKENETGIFIETAHPAKFKTTVEAIIGEEIDIPDRLAAFLNNDKKTVKMSSSFTSFKKYLMSV